MLSTSQVAVKAKWNSYTYPVLPGTPLGANGAVANTSSAVGIVMERIDKKPDNPDEELSIMAGGIVDKEELEYNLSAAAVKALNGIVFRGYDVDPLPAVTAADNGKVLGVADGAWTKVAGGGGGGALVVTFTAESDNGAYINVATDHTYAEAKAAIEAGQAVIFQQSWDGEICGQAYAAMFEDFVYAVNFDLNIEDAVMFGTRYYLPSPELETDPTMVDFSFNFVS